MKIYFHFPLGVVNGCSNPGCFVCLTQLISLDGKSLLPCQSMPKIILRHFSICCSKPWMMSYRIIVTIMKDIFSYDFLYQTLYTYIFYLFFFSLLSLPTLEEREVQAVEEKEELKNEQDVGLYFVFSQPYVCSSIAITIACKIASNIKQANGFRLEDPYFLLISRRMFVECFKIWSQIWNKP